MVRKLLIHNCQIILYVQNRKMKEKSETYRKNIDKRGNVPNSITVSSNLFNNHTFKIQKKGDKFPVGPALLGFFLFIVIGSAIFQILNMATSQGGNTVYQVNKLNIIILNLDYIILNF